MLWSKSILKRLLRLTVIFMVIVINKGDVMNLEQLTNVVKQLEETIKADQVEKSQLKSQITHLETELESVKNKGLTNEIELQETKSALTNVDRFTSCSKIASLGNLESGSYLIDTDGDGKEAPYDAFCKIPEGTTSVGENIAYDFLHCNGSYCSEKVIEFEAPIPQLLLLAEKSPECIQTVRFDCQSAKVRDVKFTQNGFDVISYLQWRDRNGDYHNFTGGDNCNNMWPQPMSDSFELSDKSLLPVSAVRYGPLRFERQKAKISVSKLTCEPYEDDSATDQILAAMNTRLAKVENITLIFDEQLVKFKEEFTSYESATDQILADRNTRLTKVENTILSFDELLVKIKDNLKVTCPTENNNYVALNNTCYFFDNQKRTYKNAQKNCKLTFGSNGHLFEPLSNEEAKTVYDVAKPVLGTGSHYWIGLEAIGRGSNDFHYASNSKPIRQQLISGNDLDNSDYAAAILSSNGQLNDNPPSDKYYSICQYTFL